MSGKRITESKARQKEALLHCAQTYRIELRELLGNAENATRGNAAYEGSEVQYAQKKIPIGDVGKL
jgi:hypothetical protein